MKYVALIISCALLAACGAWERDVERDGFDFSKYRMDEPTGMHLGVLAEDVTVDGFICAKDEWAHFRADRSLELCRLATDYRLGAVELVAGTWVMPREDRLVVAFETNTPCQDYTCRGTGGSKGVQAVFDWDGRLIAFFPTSDTEIDGVLCRASLTASVQLHPNGRLKRCVTAATVTIGGRTFTRGETVSLEATGQPQ